MQFLQIILSGLSIGCIYGLVALSFVLIYKATETVSFAQGEFMMIGAFIALAFNSLFGLPMWLAIVLAILVTGLIGIIIERVLIRPTLGEPALAVLMMTIGIGYVARGVMTMLPGIGSETHALNIPLAGKALNIDGLLINSEQVITMASTLVLCLVLYAMFGKSRIGVAMQATSQNQLAAYYMGIPVRQINGLVWGLAAAMAAVAGVLLAPTTFVYVNMGFIGLKAFPAAVIGGFGSLPGAIFGGLLIGVVEALSGFYLPEGFKDIAPYVVMLVVLVVRPNGLFGGNLRKKV